LGRLYWLQNGCNIFSLLPQDFRDRTDLDMESYARSIPPAVQVLVLHGTGDETIPYKASSV